jgi:sterol desaturase/sphingolipid hydroxylase (fatty acid hydroxylase superfamily)
MLDPATIQYVQDLLLKAVVLFTKAVFAFLQRESFLYWPFLISTLIIGVLAWRFGYAQERADGKPAWRVFFQRYLGRSLWWHPSARVDYRFYLVNAVVFPLLLGPLLLGGNSIARLLEELTGIMPDPVPSTGIVTRIVYTLLFFVAYDFGRFVAHSLLHDVPFLWEFHKVHHSAEVLTPMTSFRAHPIDLAVMAWGSAVTTGILAWLFHRYVDSSIDVYTFLGLHVIFWAGNLIGNLRHWQVWLSYGEKLNHWLISPAHHQLHHSAEPQHWGCNRGFELAIWDRLYGTLRIPANQPETFRMGLGDDTDGRWHSVGRLYAWPFLLLFQRIKNGQGALKNKR